MNVTLRPPKLSNYPNNGPLPPKNEGTRKPDSQASSTIGKATHSKGEEFTGNELFHDTLVPTSKTPCSQSAQNNSQRSLGKPALSMDLRKSPPCSPIPSTNYSQSPPIDVYDHWKIGEGLATDSSDDEANSEPLYLHTTGSDDPEKLSLNPHENPDAPPINFLFFNSSSTYTP